MALLEFPQVSVAFHVRTIVPEPLQPERLAASAYVTVGVEQLSVAVAWPVAVGRVECPHSTAVLAGRVNEGAAVSTTAIVWKPLLVLPQASVAVQVRVIVPVPAHPVSTPASEYERVGGVPELSVAVA